MNTKKPSHYLSISALSLMSVAAIASLRNLPLMAEAGLSMLFFYGLAMLIFFIPSALVSAELATAYPQSGGIYTWVKEAFGERIAFLAVWLQVAKGFVWFPTVLAFIAGTLAYMFNPTLSEDPYYTLSVILIVFWLSVYITCTGHKTSQRITHLGSLLGVVVPAIFIILLGIYWFFSGNPSHIDFSKDAIVPNLGDFHELTFLATTLVSLTGMELATVHVQDLKNPQEDYPKSALLASFIIFGVFVLGSLSIAVIVPQEAISLDAGVVQAFSGIFSAIRMPWLTPVIAAALVFGALAAVQVWLLSPAKTLLVTAQNGTLPPVFQKVNKHGIPVSILITQGIIISLFACCFLLMPSVNSSFWLLTAIRASIYLIMYVILFATAIRLRFTQPNLKRPFKISGGIFGISLIGGLGLLSSLFGIILAFFPSSKVPMGSLLTPELIQFSAVLGVLIIPFIISFLRKPSWQPKSQEPASTPELVTLP